MLNALRRGSKGFLSKILIALLVFAFAIWGISDFVNQIDPTEVAEAGNTPVPASEFARVYQRALGFTSQQMGRGLTPQDAQAIGLPDQVLSTLVTDALQIDAARRLGVDIGNDMLAERIRQDVSFSAGGNFDRALFDQILAENRYTEAEYIEIQRGEAKRAIWNDALFQGVRVPTPYLEAFNRFQNQTRTVSYFTLTDAAIGAIEDPTDAELQAYYNENTAEFRAPEYRDIAMVSLSAALLADPEAVSNDDVARAYEVDGAYGAPERRRIQQAILGDKADAESAAEAINGGAPVEATLSGIGQELADVDLGFVRRDDLVDPAVAEAAFSLNAGGAAAVDGRFGPVLIVVSEIESAGKRPLEEVEAEIRAELAMEEANAEMRTVFNRVEDAVAGGETADEIAERFSLPLRTLTVDRQGLLEDGTQPTPPVPAPLLATAFAVQEGDDPEPAEADGATHWIQVNGITPSADRPFDEVPGEVLLAWTEAEKASRIADLADEALQAIEDGAPVEDVAARYGTEALTTEPFSQGAPSASLPPAAVRAAFEGPAGHVSSVPTEEGANIVLKVAEITEPIFFEGDPNLQAPERTLSEGMTDTMLFEFVSAWQGEVGATVNRTIINQIIGIEPRHGHGGMR
ncbi:MAG: SurA N-terminal domain-containing protein [Pseudomonadota bacterium]